MTMTSKIELSGHRLLKQMTLVQMADIYLDPGEISTTRELVGNALLGRLHEVEGCGWSAQPLEGRDRVLRAIRSIGQ